VSTTPAQSAFESERKLSIEAGIDSVKAKMAKTSDEPARCRRGAVEK